MPGFFDAIKKIKPGKKVYTVTIQGQSIVVSLEKKLEVQRTGEDAYTWKTPTEFVLKQKKTTNRRLPVLKREILELGYEFYNNDPYWVESIVEKGYAWQIEQE
tara:strand:+ start:181 stop:489 length:309 start_codon:yes stop_codon:yes gene_type:complete